MVFILSFNKMKKLSTKTYRKIHQVSLSNQLFFWRKQLNPVGFSPDWEHANIVLQTYVYDEIKNAGNYSLTFKYKIITNFSVIFKNHCVKIIAELVSVRHKQS